MTVRASLPGLEPGLLASEANTLSTELQGPTNVGYFTMGESDWKERS
jgi:hypothetical protein